MLAKKGFLKYQGKKVAGYVNAQRFHSIEKAKRKLEALKQDIDVLSAKAKEANGRSDYALSKKILITLKRKQRLIKTLTAYISMATKNSDHDVESDS